MPVSLQIIDPSRSRLGEPLRQVLGVLKIARGSWSIALVGDQAMAELHGRTMGLPTTTDVLTFDLRDGMELGVKGGMLDLETVISVDEARRRAKELGHALRHELVLYCVHSLLHVQGYDDLTAAEAARMHAREDELLEEIGLPAVYAGAGIVRARKGRKRAVAGARKGGRAG